MLVQMCRCDHGYNLIAWHNELCETKVGGYNWGKRKGTPKNIQNALADPAWCAAVAQIQQVDAEHIVVAQSILLLEALPTVAPQPEHSAAESCG